MRRIDGKIIASIVITAGLSLTIFGWVYTESAHATSINDIETGEEAEEEFTFVPGYEEMPWDSNLPGAKSYVSFEDAQDLLIDEKEESLTLKKGITEDDPAEAYPYSYDKEDEIKAYLAEHLPPLRNQGSYGTCWAHSSIALLETYLINNTDQGDRNGTVDRDDVDYSELQLAYFYYTHLANAMVGEQGETLSLLYGKDNSLLDYGGNVLYAAQTLMNWKGATEESTVPYSYASEVAEAESSSTTASVMPDSLGYDEDTVHLQNVYEINITDNQMQVKQAIMSNGIVGISYYETGNSTFYDSDYNSYYNNYYSTTTHAVCIVGWDDNFPKENFKETADSDGAWLVRNSWLDETTEKGEDIFSHSGYFWISYCDNSLSGRTAYVFEADTSEDYDNNYSYTPQIHSSYGYSYGKSVANVYTAEGDETLQAISFETGSSASSIDYTVEIYTGVSTDDTLTLGDEAAATASGKVVYPGMYTITLDESVNLTEGEKFAVVIKSSSDYLVASEYMTYNSNFSSTVVENSGESYYLSGSTWVDYSTKNSSNSYRGNFCINALTTDTTSVSRVTGLKCTDYGTDSIALRWTAMSGAGSYQVQRADSPAGDFSTVGTTESVAYTDSDLTAGTKYYYRIVPVVDESAVTASKSYILGVETAPNITETPTVTAGYMTGTGKAILKITGSGSYDGCIINYKAQGASAYTKAYAVSVSSGVWRYYPDPGVYTVTAQFYKMSGGTEYTGPVTDELTVYIYDVPGNLLGYYDGSGVGLSWDAVEDADYYMVYRNSSYIGYTTYTNCADTGVSSSATYTYYVMAGKYSATNLLSTGFRSDVITISTSSPNYPVIFNTNGGSSIDTFNVNVGEKVTQPDNPTKEGFRFDGWYTDADLTIEYDFDTEMAEGILTLYAKWYELAEQTLTFTSDTVSKTYGDDAFKIAAAHTTGDGAVTYESSDTDVATVDGSTGEVTICGVGTTTITATAALKDYYLQATASYTLTVSKRAVTVSITGNTDTAVYDGSAHTVSGYTITKSYTSYPDSAISFSGTAAASQTNAGTSYIGLTADMFSNTNSNYSVTFTIASDGYIEVTKATAAVETAPTAYSLTYTGSAQELVTAGAASGGTMKYSLDATSWSASVPTATAAGTYTVYYKVAGDSNHNDTSANSVSVTIDKADGDTSVSNSSQNETGGSSGSQESVGQGTESSAANTTAATETTADANTSTTAQSLSATIKASKLKLNKGKKATVKITSDSGAKLKVTASNGAAKKAVKSKIIKIKSGKSAKIVFSKKIKKGKYKFKVTSPTNGSYVNTVKTITITVK